MPIDPAKDARVLRDRTLLDEKVDLRRPARTVVHGLQEQKQLPRGQAPGRRARGERVQHTDRLGQPLDSGGREPSGPAGPPPARPGASRGTALRDGRSLVGVDAQCEDARRRVHVDPGDVDASVEGTRVGGEAPTTVLGRMDPRHPPRPGDSGVADPEEPREGPRRPSDAVGRSAGPGLFEDRRQLRGRGGLTVARPRGILDDARQTQEGKARAPSSDRHRAEVQNPSNLLVGSPFPGQQDDPRPFGSPHRDRSTPSPPGELRPLPCAEGHGRGDSH